MRYVKVDKATGAKIGGPERKSTPPANPAHKPHAWLPMVTRDSPDFDEATEKLVFREGVSEDGTEWIREEIVADKTAQEQRDHIYTRLQTSDTDIVTNVDDLANRLDDLVDALVAAGVIRANDVDDYPDELKGKLTARETMRARARRIS